MVERSPMPRGMPGPRALLVDDDPALRMTIRAILEDEGVEVEEADDGSGALACLDDRSADIVITDLRMPGMDGIELLSRIRERDRPPRVIVVTGHGSERRAVDAMKRGAYDYLTKPCDVEQLVAVVRRAVESATLENENQRLMGELALSRFLVYRSDAMRGVAAIAARVASQSTTVLVTGESGTGKERLAEAIVAASPRASAPFVRFACAALTPELGAAELFGHAKGAFSGAESARDGLFRAADGGTLLLDEVGELDLSIQAMLLRTLQEGEVRPIGRERSVHVDVRVIATTRHDLTARVREGRFREDLYYRLRVVEIPLPALRERPEDVPVLVEHFFDLFAAHYGTPPLRVPPLLHEHLAAREWRGNVRELRNVVEGLVALSVDGAIDASVLSDDGTAAGWTPATLKQKTSAYERGVILTALREAGGNRSVAAKALGVSRATLHEKLTKHDVGKRWEKP